MIPREIISEIRHRADIVDVISDYVSLKPTGSNNYKGLCPFHKEKTPSFSVNRAEGFYHCFGCKESGNSITFLQKYLNITFLEAVKMLAHRYGIKIESDFEERTDTEESLLYRLYDSAKDYYISELYRVGDRALDFYKERKLTDETIVKFGLGYSPNNFDGLVKHFLNGNYSSQILIKSGLLRENEYGKYDFFRNRAMFPIRDFIGRTIAFGGRQLEKDNKSGKYINSADSLIYDKKQTLYGLYEAKTEIRKTKSAFIVEGYLDVISLQQAGNTNVVAPCGTSLSLEQLRALKKHTGCDTLYFMFDGDEAGKNATFRNIEIALPLGFDLQIINLPDNDDPDTLINSDGGKDKFDILCKESKNFVEHIYKTLTNKNKLRTPAEKTAAIRNLLKLILLLPDKLQHKYYVDFVVDLFNVDVNELRRLYTKMRDELKDIEIRRNFETINKGDLQDLIKPENTIEDFTTIINTEFDEESYDDSSIEEELQPIERAVFNYILQHNNNFNLIQEKYKFSEDFLITNFGKDIYFWINEYRENENIFQIILENEYVPNKIKELLSELKMQKVNESRHWNRFSNIKASNTDVELIEIPLLQLKSEQIRRELEELGKKIQQSNTEERLLKRYKELIEQRNKYSDLLNELCR